MAGHPLEVRVTPVPAVEDDRAGRDVAQFEERQVGASLRLRVPLVARAATQQYRRPAVGRLIVQLRWDVPASTMSPATTFQTYATLSRIACMRSRPVIQDQTTLPLRV